MVLVGPVSAGTTSNYCGAESGFAYPKMTTTRPACKLNARHKGDLIRHFLLVSGFAMRTTQPDAGILLILENGQKGVEEARVLLCL